MKRKGTIIRKLTSQAAIVVDGYRSTAAQLAHAFSALGFETVHVRSRAHDPRASEMTVQTQHLYRADLLVESADDLEVLADYFRRGGCRPRAAVSGSDSGTELVDAIAKRFNIRGNSPATSGLRYRKGAMARRLQQMGLDNIPTVEIRSTRDAEVWLSQHTGPYVVKPDVGTGSKGFCRIEDRSGLQSVIAEILATRNAYGDLHETVILQPYVHGVEYAVNTITRGGQTVIMDVWKTIKQLVGSSKIYDLEILVGPMDADYEIVTQYVGDVLSVLGVVNGPAHTEVILTAGKPHLIETGARMMGSISVSQHSTVFGLSPLGAVADYAFDQPGFDRLLQQGYPSPRCCAAMVQMHSNQHGNLGVYNESGLQALPSFHEVDFNVPPGGPIVPTRDSYTSPGLIFLIHNDWAQIKADYRKIRRLERDGRLQTFA